MVYVAAVPVSAPIKDNWLEHQVPVQFDQEHSWYQVPGTVYKLLVLASSMCYLFIFFLLLGVNDEFCLNNDSFSFTGPHFDILRRG